VDAPEDEDEEEDEEGDEEGDEDEVPAICTQSRPSTHPRSSLMASSSHVPPMAGDSVSDCQPVLEGRSRRLAGMQRQAAICSGRVVS